MSWSGGYAEWTEGDTAFLSIAFTWLLDKAYSRAIWYRAGRIREVIEWGGEPHVQPYIKLNALEKVPHARFDWTTQKLRDVARWANGHVWRRAPFSEYDRSMHKRNEPFYDATQGLFAEVTA